MYRYYAEIYGARIAVLRYTSEMHFPLEAVLVALRKKIRAFLHRESQYPTGTLLHPEAIRRS